MRKLLFAAILCFLAASPLRAAIAYDNVAGHFACAGQTSASTTYTLTVAFTSGNTSVVIVTFPSSTTTVVSVTDNASSAYGTNPNLRKVSGTTASVEIWYTAPGGVRGSVTTVTVTTSASGRFAVCGMNFSGVVGIGKPGAGATGTSTSPSASQNTVDNNNYIVAGMAHATGSNAWSGSGSTNVSATYAGATSTPGAAATYNFAATPGSVTNAATITSAVWAVSTLEFRTVTNNTMAGVR